MASAAAVELHQTPPPSHFPLRLIAAGTVGNVMEWYDFAVYGYFARIIGDHFFPSENPTASLIAAFGVFAAGFLMRPLGGVVFGHIGDRIGRKAALTVSVLAMAIPTFLIGVLPGYAHLGPAAAVILVVLRMIQGLSVGGEYTTSIVFLVEGTGRKHHGFAGSWSGFGSVGGILLGSAIGAVITATLSEEAVQSWGWRVPFLIGLVVGIAGLYIREHIPESPVPEKHKTGRSPVLEAFRTEWRSIGRIAALNVINGVAFYLAFVFLVTYMSTVGGLPEATALEINTLNMMVLLVMIPFSGWLSDRIGRKPVLIAGVGGLLVFSWPLFMAMEHSSAVLDFFGQLGFAILIGLFGGTMPVTMVETTKREVRCCAISIGYNLCVGVLGGTAPMIATWLVSEHLTPAYYVMGAAFVSLVAILLLPETSRQAEV